MRKYYIYSCVNCPSVIEEMTFDKIMELLPKNQKRELSYRIQNKLPFSFYFNDQGNLNMSHRDDWKHLEGLG